MDDMQKTKEMIDAAIKEGLKRLELFKTAINGLSGEERMEAGRDWLRQNGVPSIRPRCLNCGNFLGGVPLVNDKENDFLITEDPAGDYLQYYFNESVVYRTCSQCGQRYPKI